MLTAPKSPSLLSLVPAANTENDWLKSLQQIQEESAFAALPEPVGANTVAGLLQEAQSDNLTQTLARTLFINLSEAKSQGLGDDIPTQDKLIEEATVRAQNRATHTYRSADLMLTAATNATVRAYGSDVMAAFMDENRVSLEATYLALGSAVDSGDAAHTAKLARFAVVYRDLARTLSEVPVPQTLAPLHLSLVNNINTLYSAHADMAAILTDPIRGLSGLQQFQLIQEEASRIFTNIALELQKSGILFTKDEPGNAWSVFLTSP